MIIMEMNENVEMITGDPKKAINKLAWPMIASMFLIFLNNIVDSIWVAGLGPAQPLSFLVILVLKKEMRQIMPLFTLLF